MSQLELLTRLDLHAQQRGNQIAYRKLTGCCESWTWRELHQAVQFWSNQFAQKLEAGQTILVSSPNRPEVAVAILAGFSAGLRVFLVSPELSEVELLKQVEAAKVVAAICTERAAAWVARKLKLIWCIDDLVSALESAEANPTRGAGDLILQSSGTTGFPRLVLRCGKSVDAVSRQMVKAIGFGTDDRVLAMLPLSHSYGLEHGLLAPVWAGSTVLLGQGLDIASITRELSEATIFPTVPSVIEILADLPGPASEMPNMRRIYSAGGPLPRTVFERFYARYGTRVSQLYGATEVGSVTFNPPDHSHFDPGSVGLPLDGVKIRIADQLHPEQILRNGEEGQVLARAESMFESYLDGEPLLVDGYFPTGDLGVVDMSGHLTITGRLKLLIDVGGVKVNPLEVESVLREHPDVGQCVVVPVRQSETVYRIKAIATPRDPARPPSIDELRKLARQRLATYKVPRTIEIRPSLPTTPTGKVLRHLVETT